jgi:serine/threonine protein kinase/tetratricopeptide (TPR) repeat protein
MGRLARGIRIVLSSRTQDRPMTNPSPTEETIFLASLEKAAGPERIAFVAAACAGNEALYHRALELLAGHDASRGPLDALPLPVGATAEGGSERPGTQIGPYKLLQQIGEGGMGMVYMAEQIEPVRRRVALKIIKPGMDTRQVIARFEAERQALAMMDHVDIARVFDAGTTAGGRPYFVMELVNGVPITQYCDDQRLTPRERLELFVPVCQAIQHAHQKGIIHRDIKPSNVMVTLYDGKPVPKVIDFGVAKATEQKLTERTLFTQYGTLVGTLEYMSPEQAEMSALGVDTRSDIYSLGVLLYELLTGSTPLSSTRMKEAAYAEILRMIKEEEPQKPSTRLSESGERLASISAQRHTEPAKLSKLLRGELDWIVMKTLEKDRNRRYETATGFAADLQHYLNDEPVVACPPTAAYRVRKFASRYRAALVTTAGFVAVLLAATTLSTWLAIRAISAEGLAQSRFEAEAAARQDAEAARKSAKAEANKAQTEAAIARAVNAFINTDLLAQAHPLIARARYKEPERELKLRTVLDRAAARIEGRFQDQPLVEAALRNTIGTTYLNLGEKRLAEPQLRRAVELRRAGLGEEHHDTLRSMNDLGRSCGDEELRRRVEAIQRRVLGEENPETLWSQFGLALEVRDRGDTAQAIALFRDLLAVQQRALGDDNYQTAWTMHCLAHTLSGYHDAKGAHDAEIERLHRHALGVLRKGEGEASWSTWDVTLRLGQFLSARGRYDEAEAVLEDGYTRLESQPAVTPEWAAELAKELAAMYQKQDHSEQAEAWERKRAAAYESALARNSRLLHEQIDNPGLLLSHASLLTHLDRLGEAEAACLMASNHDPNSLDVVNQLLAIANAYHQRRDWGQAERLYRRALAIQVLPEALSTQVATTLHTMAVTLREQGDVAEAEKVHREALAILRKQLGDNHVTTAWEIHDLAFLLGRIPGRQAEAEVLYREALRVRRQVLGDGDARTADTAFRLAQVLGAQEKFEEAEVLLQKTHAALVANRGTVSAREYEAVLIPWVVEMYQGWNKPERAAEWEQRLPPMGLGKPEPPIESK